MEELQTLVLTTLDRDNVIEDTKNLKSTQGDALDQLAVLGVLNSLKSKDVCVIPTWQHVNCSLVTHNDCI